MGIHAQCMPRVQTLARVPETGFRVIIRNVFSKYLKLQLEKQGKTKLGRVHTTVLARRRAFKQVLVQVDEDRSECSLAHTNLKRRPCDLSNRTPEGQIENAHLTCVPLALGFKRQEGPRTLPERK